MGSEKIFEIGAIMAAPKRKPRKSAQKKPPHKKKSIESPLPKSTPTEKDIKAEEFEKEHKARVAIIGDTSSVPPEKLKIKSGDPESEQKGVLVVFLSGIGYGGEGYRRGLVRLASQVAQQKGVAFGILNGGLIDKKNISEAEKEHIKRRKQELKESGSWRYLSPEERVRVIADEKKIFRAEIARAIAESIPHIQKSGNGLAKIYIITSPTYDGLIGSEIAQKLSEIRNEDMVYCGHGTNVNTPILIKYVDKTILPIVPEEATAPFRNRYYSTKSEGRIRQVEKRTPRDMPDILAAGCEAAMVHRPAGESRRPWFIHPVLRNITKTLSSENQVGVAFLRYRSKKDGDYTIINRSFKGLLAKERKYIKKPSNLTSLQDKIFEAIRDGAKTIGLIEYYLKNHGELQVSRESIHKNLEQIAVRAKILFNENSSMWDFAPEVLQNDIVYPFIENLETYCDEDNIVGFGCLHSGATCTDYRFFIEEGVRLILETNANILVGAGDFTQGLAHGMLERGEVIVGMNDTLQEIFAAHLVGEVMVRSFAERLKQFLKKAYDKKKKLSVEKLIKDFLVDFLWVAGNHDEWKKRRGSSSLKTFKDALITYVTEGVEAELLLSELLSVSIRSIVASKIAKDSMAKKVNYISPRTGLAYKAVHPHTARTETISIWAERCLAKWRDAHVVLAANWHTAARVEHYDAHENKGQRLVLQCPTLCTHTPFEDSKVKTTDFGFTFAKIRSRKGRIIEVEAGFDNTPTMEKDLDNLDFVNEGLVSKIGCKPIIE